MKYCYTCRMHSPSENHFCTQCGSSFNIKYCSRLHPNSASAEFCAICGSAELSNPGPHPPGLGKLAVVLSVTALLFSVGVVWLIARGLSAEGELPPRTILFIMIIVAIVLALFSRRQRNPRE
jgi:hypothetical protein